MNVISNDAVSSGGPTTTTSPSATSPLSQITIAAPNRNEIHTAIADAIPPAGIFVVNRETQSVPASTSGAPPGESIAINYESQILTTPILSAPESTPASTSIPFADGTSSNIDSATIFVGRDGKFYNSSGNEIVVNCDEVVVETKKHSLEDVVRVQTAMGFKIVQIQVDMGNILHCLKRLDAKIDLLTTSPFESAKRVFDGVPQKIIIRKPMESVEVFDEFEKNLER